MSGQHSGAKQIDMGIAVELRKQLPFAVDVMEDVLFQFLFHTGYFLFFFGLFEVGNEVFVV